MKGNISQPTFNSEAFSSSTHIASSGWGTVKAGTPGWSERKIKMDTVTEVSVSSVKHIASHHMLSGNVILRRTLKIPAFSPAIAPRVFPMYSIQQRKEKQSCVLDITNFRAV